MARKRRKDRIGLKLGSYSSNSKKLKFSDFYVGKFTAHFFPGTWSLMNGCGSTTLALLTGVDPNHLPPLDSWKSKYMRDYLISHGFRVARLTLRNLTDVERTSYPIQGHHVILARLKFIKDQASWAVIHDDRIYHNFEVSDFKCYELINHPLMEAYLLQHESWTRMAVPVNQVMPCRGSIKKPKKQWPRLIPWLRKKAMKRTIVETLKIGDYDL